SAVKERLYRDAPDEVLQHPEVKPLADARGSVAGIRKVEWAARASKRFKKSGLFCLAPFPNLPGGSTPARDCALHPATVAFVAGGLAGEIQRVVDGCGQRASRIGMAYRRVAVGAAGERVRLPVMHMPCYKLAGEFVECSPQHMRERPQRALHQRIAGEPKRLAGIWSGHPSREERRLQR